MRLFIAVNLEPGLRAGIAAASEPIRGIFGDARWVATDLLHLTVKFLGERERSFVDQLISALDNVAERYRSIPFSIGGIGAFPNLRRPSVVWIGVHGDSKLELINHDVERACELLGVPVDGRPFRPHITLARVKSRSPEGAHAFATAVQKIAYHAHSSVQSLDLMLSEQRDGRLRYTALHRANLRP